jgi:hypothetical protein
MRLSLFILGVFSALICIERPAEAQNQPWCIYKDDGEGNPAVPVRDIATMLGRPPRQQHLFTQSVPILAGDTE